MITVRTGAYTTEDLVALYYALEEAIITLQNHATCLDCDRCEVRNACNDLNSTIDYLSEKLSEKGR